MAETVPCTLCAAVESPGFYTGCMVRDGHAPEWDCDGKGNLTKKEIAMADIKVEVCVEGGMVTMVKAPPGVEVVINDYDILDASPSELEQDENGADYIETTLEGTGHWEDA
ncbi:hypothetical protein [Bradyrhizobium phage BDU-MI-1]|nr:hypothetical protein [Bradyrhizobium phage BDU-MI-1]